MVSSAEKFSLEEASRTARMLENDSDAKISQVVLNRIVERGGHCRRCQKRAALYDSALRFIERRFPKADIFRGEDPGAPIIGVERLSAFGQHIFEDKPLKLNLARAKSAPGVKLEAVEWPVTKTRLTMTLGKGGVGKTTISGGLAYIRRKRHPKESLLICSTDPAPSLDDLFEQKIGANPSSVLNDQRFGAVEIDSPSEYLRWSRKVKQIMAQSLEIQQGGVHLELSFEHEMISALLDIVPPGVDEIFAVFKLLDFIESRKLALVIDMAPTGHALELLRTPERLVVWTRLLLKSLSAHRKLPLAQELAVEVASISQRARELAELLKDPKSASVFVVMLPEPLPDRQTGRLLQNLTDLELSPSAVFVNRVLTKEEGCSRCELARQWQMATMARLPTEKLTHYAVADYQRQIAGPAGLAKLTRRLWKISPERTGRVRRQT
jgi:arsenite-transporting ATPase